MRIQALLRSSLVIAFSSCALLAAEPVKIETPPKGVILASNGTNQQMLERFRLDLSQRAAEYGNPPFAFLFSNDPEAAEKVNAKLLQMMQLDDGIAQRKKTLSDQDVQIKTNEEILARQNQAMKLNDERIALKEKTVIVLDREARAKATVLAATERQQQAVDARLAAASVRAQELRILTSGIAGGSTIPASSEPVVFTDTEGNVSGRVPQQATIPPK